MKTIFIFPKPFEFFKFIAYLFNSKEYTVLDIQQIDEYEFHIYLGTALEKHESIVYRFETLLIRDSDINFYGLFSKLVNNSSDRNYILIGSCGSTKAEEFGKCFLVTEATKGDRGTLDATSKFKLDSDKAKKATRQHYLWDAEKRALLSKKTVEERKACSTNFLNENMIDEKFKDGYLFDMETYDFYDICSKKGVTMYSCVRFVTDYVLPDTNAKAVDIAAYQNTLAHSEEAKELVAEITNLQPKIEISRVKKYVRLRLSISFDFVFQFNLQGNIVSDEIRANVFNVDKYYHNFREEYIDKLREVNEKVREPNKEGFEKNKKKIESWLPFLRDIRDRVINIHVKKVGSGVFHLPPGSTAVLQQQIGKQHLNQIEALALDPFPKAEDGSSENKG